METKTVTVVLNVRGEIVTIRESAEDAIALAVQFNADPEPDCDGPYRAQTWAVL